MAQIEVLDLLPDIAQFAREAPHLTLMRAYVRAARGLCRKARYLTRNVTLATAADTPVYDLALPSNADVEEVIGIRALSVTVSAEDIRVLTDSDSGEWDPNSTRGDGVPEFYQYMPPAQVGLFMTPAAGWALLATCIVQPKVEATTLDEGLVTMWREAFDAGALGFVLNLNKTPWTDKTEAQRQQSIYMSYCNKAMSAARRGKNAGAMPTDASATPSGAVRTSMLPI